MGIAVLFTICQNRLATHTTMLNVACIEAGY